MCIGGYFPDGTPAPPGNYGDAQFCKGGCDLYKGPDALDLSSEPRNVCHVNCNGVCAPDPPYGGVCPAACTGGCAGGVCNIVCDGNDPALSCTQQINSFRQVTKPIVKCPEGLPCNVTCKNGGCDENIISCPRGSVSCVIDCGVDGSCSLGHFYCGAGRCTLRGVVSGGGRRGAYPEYNFAIDVCGPSCSCDVPYMSLGTTGAPVRCQCKDYEYIYPVPGTLGGGKSGADVCPAACAAHGGWSVPWERTPNAW